MEPQNHPARAIYKTQETFLPLRVGGANGGGVRSTSFGFIDWKQAGAESETCLTVAKVSRLKPET